MERHYAGQHRVGIILFQYYIIIIIFYYVGGSHRVPAVQQGQQVGHRALAGAGGLYNISPYDWVVTCYAAGGGGQPGAVQPLLRGHDQAAAWPTHTAAPGSRGTAPVTRLLMFNLDYDGILIKIYNSL